ncbi:DUF2972 domain-containing protein [Campylobacter novaezeelandiae]|uniref:DUF2972 domain-containing protein n=1 Tax=Campylobacter novaezeelandiae TaxID=2267891 RepID=UPI0019039770|nr:DUF2972 domain-containing protein [Campylobacter novaezeelandiae]MBK1964584.1 DUF2972 domain-containing protein [Campylobacter novaezeelandiae]MBK1993918.1 DUF2972 domain-containing protein [Campylobacter novaezeelandiae]
MKPLSQSKSFKLIKEKGFKAWLEYRYFKILRTYEKHIVLKFTKQFKPLPKNYKFILCSYSVSAHWALGEFLQFCNLKKVIAFEDGLTCYYTAKRKLKKVKNSQSYLDLIFWNKENKYISNITSIFEPTKILILTRDPISRFKTFINHGRPSNNIGMINLNDDLNEVFKILYLGERRENEVKPSLKALKCWKNSNKTLNFNYYSNIKAFLESKKEFKIFYIDCKELDSKIAFNTMNKLAKILDFNPPNIKDKEKFEHKFWNKFAHLLPFNLLLDKKTFPYLSKDIKLNICEAKLSNTPPLYVA